MAGIYCRFAIVFVFLIFSAGAVPNPILFQIKESVATPRNWNIIGRPVPHHPVSLRVSLPQPQFSTLENHIHEVSDPDHARYGMHLSKEDVEKLVSPDSDALGAVNQWLTENGIHENNCHRSPAQDWVKFTVPVSKAEELLNTTYYIWQHAIDGDMLVRTLEYSVPEHLHRHIELIQPTNMFTRLRRLKHDIVAFEKTEASNAVPGSDHSLITDSITGISVNASCNNTITLGCLAQIYNYSDYVPKAADKNMIGVTGYLNEFANFMDLQTFYADQLPKAVNSSFEVQLVNRGTNDQDPAHAGIEANLDVQFAFGATFPTPGIFWSTAGSPPFIPDNLNPVNGNEPYIEWLDFVLSKQTLPPVISNSYGDDEQTVPEAYARHACAQFAQLAARGISVIVSSGDFGVGGTGGDGDPLQQVCLSNNGKNQTEFIPVFPASCPFVTVVGGTTSFPEVAVSRFFSGGGFSNYFSRPIWQSAHVDEYLSKLAPGTYEGLFNRNGRAYPDVATQCDHYRIVVGNTFGLVAGTSASSPTFSGVITLLNDARLAAGRPVLGFLNPFLYSIGVSALNDITVGNNAGCGTPGFNATTGWDPVTGLGTPNFGLLKEF